MIKRKNVYNINKDNKGEIIMSNQKQTQKVVEEKIKEIPEATVEESVETSKLVSKDDVIAIIAGENNVEVRATISGIIRGLIRDEYPVTKGFKIADIDPRVEELRNCFTISDKARCISGSVLELVCANTVT